MRGRFYAFIISRVCGTAYRIETEADGAHCKAAVEQYEALPGEEHVINDEGGSFWCKQLSGPSGRRMDP